MKEKFKKTVEVVPAYDFRSKGGGIHGCELRFMFYGPKGATQLVIYTNWQLTHVAKELASKPGMSSLDIECRFLPMPADLGYHSFKPTYDGQEQSQESCPYLGGKPCYYDGSGLNARPVFERMLRDGSDGVWDELEKYYNRVFEKENAS